MPQFFFPRYPWSRFGSRHNFEDLLLESVYCGALGKVADHATIMNFKAHFLNGSSPGGYLDSP